ncbi:hypothetical protein [Undibacterium pigrum]|uniref:Uncharacterized protein n=1 Tax=Undibacterium pigrum TaxID=401470 RepID=A0A318IP60_9BURK|nr:hypothetical protein [Undibacterium pigrum]PXX35287.1 hypothetical protein DFR42_12122 [Undibacterium pigrum]
MNLEKSALPTFVSPDETVSKESQAPNAAQLDKRRVLNLPHDKPLIMLVGPHNVGKTAILGSLIAYSTHKLAGNIPTRHAFSWLPLPDILQHVPEGYRNQTNQFLEKIAASETYIGSTSEYFVINAKQNERPLFIALEAPGEDYFSIEQGLFSPLYLSDLAERSHDKVYLFVFSHDMFGGDPSKMAAYDKAVSEFIRAKVKPGRDRFLLLYTKIKNDPVMQTGMTELECANKAFSAGGKFPETASAYRNSPIKGKKIIPYWSGTFKTDVKTNTEYRAHPAHEYPARLTEAMLTLLVGSPWWKFWA